jgi:hypothetical protein
VRRHEELTKAALLKDDSGVNILLEFIFSLVVMVILFTLMLLFISNIISNSDRTILTEEYDIIANDVANRMSAFSSEVYLNDQKGSYDSTVVENHVVYFDLPEPINNKQYQVEISYTNKMGTVRVSYVSDSTIYSIATFYSYIPVEDNSFNSHQGRYSIYYKMSDNKIKVENVI